jgi:BRCT domain type II-containing protein
MPPKSKATGSFVYVVLNGAEVDSVQATSMAASQRVVALDSEEAEVVKKELLGGTIQIAEKTTAKEPAAPSTAKASKREQPDEPNIAPASKKKKVASDTAKDVKVQNTDKPKPTTSKPKTKTPAEQRAENAKKTKKGPDEDLPDNIKALLEGSGDSLSGKTIVVTGVPPTLGRKHTEALVTKYGGHLTKSLSKNTSLVVVGNDAGPTKLEKIEELGLQTMDEDEFVAMLEQ